MAVKVIIEFEKVDSGRLNVHINGEYDRDTDDPDAVKLAVAVKQMVEHKIRAWVRDSNKPDGTTPTT